MRPYYQPWAVDWKIPADDESEFVPTVPPTNISPPIIIPTGGFPLYETVVYVGSPGIWSDGALVGYQWYNDNGIIVGATSSSYELQSSDFGVEVWVEETWGNIIGTTSVISNKIQTTFYPVNLIPPAIAIVGNEATVTSPGSWDFEDSVSGQWYRNGVLESGQTSTTYTGTLDFGDNLTYRETAENIYGETIQDSNTVSYSGFAIEELAGLNQSITGGIGDTLPYSPDESAGLNQSITGTLT